MLYGAAQMTQEEIEDRLANQDWTAAEEGCREFLRGKPVNPKVNGYLGWCLMQRKDHVGAVESLRRALNLDPKMWKAGLYLSQCLIQLNRYQEAWPVVEDSIKLAPNDRTLLALRDFLQDRVKHRGERWEINQRVEAKIVMHED